MPAHLLYGDNYLVSQALKELRQQVGQDEVIEANSHRAQANQLNLAQLKAMGNAVPFLADHRLVIVEGLFSLFESRDTRRRGRASEGRGQSASNDWGELPAYVGNEMPPSTLLVFVDGSVSPTNPMLAKLRQGLQVQQLTSPSGEGLARWIRNKVEEKGARITPGAIALLTELVGSNLWTMDNELEKLSLRASDRAIEEGDVRLLVPEGRDASIFRAVDAILEGRSGAALQSLHRLRDEGADFSYILAMIARQVRLISLARDMLDRKTPQAAIGKALGLTREFALRRAVEQARKHSWPGLRWLYGRLLEADLTVKQGRIDQDLALELLVAETSLSPVRASSFSGRH